MLNLRIAIRDYSMILCFSASLASPLIYGRRRFESFRRWGRCVVSMPYVPTHIPRVITKWLYATPRDGRGLKRLEAINTGASWLPRLPSLPEAEILAAAVRVGRDTIKIIEFCQPCLLILRCPVL